MTWKIILFELKRGEKPVEEFINSLNDTTTAKIAHTLDLLQKYGYRMGMPHSKKIDRDLFELRIKGSEEVRIFYAFKNNRIVLIHGFKKKTQKTPAREIDMALKRLKSLT